MSKKLFKYFCADCNSFLLNKKELKSHNLKKHRNDVNLPAVKCDICKIVLLGYCVDMDLHVKGEFHKKTF